MKMAFGVVGDPVKHSLSPVVHKAAFEFLGIEADYNFFEIEQKNLESFLDKVRREKISGLSITLPHKENILPLLDEVDKTAKIIGAVNTVMQINGRLKGYNTDWQGALLSLQQVLELKDKKVTIIGAGGAAMAVAYACLQGHSKVTILNRTIEKAKKIADQFEIQFDDLMNIDHYCSDIIIQTTPVGMGPNANISPISNDYFKNCLLKNSEGQKKAGKKNQLIAMDIIYQPAETRFLKDAKSAGFQTISGQKMFLYQAAKQFEIWFEQKAPFEIMEQAFLKNV